MYNHHHHHYQYCTALSSNIVSSVTSPAMGIQGGMNVHHHLARGFNWEHEPPPTSLTLGCKRLRPLAPKADSCFDLKSFVVRPQTSSSPRQQGSSDIQKNQPPPSPRVQVEAQPPVGVTRWNPTQEQIGLLEMLYRGGMRTPNAKQIEEITGSLAKYGKVEGKNVFYWFQNHKARERQKQKRYNNHNSINSGTAPKLGDEVDGETNGGQRYKRKCRTWGLGEEERRICRDEGEELGEDRTLKLFPLHPEGRS